MMAFVGCQRDHAKLNTWHACPSLPYTVLHQLVANVLLGLLTAMDNLPLCLASPDVCLHHVTCLLQRPMTSDWATLA
jgi:hypothetical protein